MLRSRFPGGDEDSGKPPVSSPEIEEEKGHKVASGRQIRFYQRRWFHILVSLLLFLYVFIPMFFYLYPPIRRHSVFLNYVSLSRVGNLSQPEAYGLPCARQLFLPSDAGVKLGTWVVWPSRDCPEEPTKFDPNQPVVVYIHGNAGTRGGGHRVELYKLLTSGPQLNLPVVAFDYRGFGDSSNVAPSARGLVRDARAIYDWVQRNGGSRILVWGHSLGTAVSVEMVAQLCREDRCPMGLLLEAPFTKVSDAAKYYPLTIIHRYMPFFESIFVRSLEGEETHLDSEASVGDVRNPILILHAKDDAMVPIHLGKQLYDTATRKKCSVSMIEFPQFGHKGIYKDPKLPQVVRDFLISIS